VTGLVQLLNNTIRQRTLAAGVVADDFTAFRSAASTPLAAAVKD